MGCRYKRTRIVAQDMKTGEFAYADELIKDGYYPNLWILPKNYDPPQPVGQSIRLPLELIFNQSPPNIRDTLIIPMSTLVDTSTGAPPILPLRTSKVGNVNVVLS